MSGSLRNQIQVLYLVGLFLLCSTELRGKQTDFLPFMVLRNSRNLYKIYYSKKFSLFWKNIEIWNNLVFLIGLFLVVYCYTVFKAIRPISTGNNSQCVLKNLFIIIYFIILFNSDYSVLAQLGYGLAWLGLAGLWKCYKRSYTKKGNGI